MNPDPLARYLQRLPTLITFFFSVMLVTFFRELMVTFQLTTNPTFDLSTPGHVLVVVSFIATLFFVVAVWLSYSLLARLPAAPHSGTRAQRARRRCARASAAVRHLLSVGGHLLRHGDDALGERTALGDPYDPRPRHLRLAGLLEQPALVGDEGQGPGGAGGGKATAGGRRSQIKTDGAVSPLQGALQRPAPTKTDL